MVSYDKYLRSGAVQMAREKQNLKITAAEIVEAVDGSLIHRSESVITGICSLDELRDGCLSFTTTSSLKQISEMLQNSPLSALLVSAEVEGVEQLVERTPPENLPTLIGVKNPMLAFCKVAPLFFDIPQPERGVSDFARVHPGASIGENVAIGDFCSIGADCVIEDNATLHPHVTVYPGARIGKGALLHAQSVVREDCTVGEGCIVQNGAVVGADGFGYTPCPEMGIRHVPQVGGVEISSQVEIGANSCVDRGTLGTTKIGVGSKIDNLVQIGHNARIGSHSLLCGQVGIAGSCSIGNQVTLGGMAGVKDHIRIADGVRVAGRSGVITDLPEKGDYAGFPAIKAGDWKRLQTALVRLPGIVKDLRRQARNK
jgi:UDP-3-O-[3-hydroxymyristoyl] glucosamine N-acyltransferase